MNAALLRGFCTHAGCRCLVSGSFQTSSEALFSFHSRYYCAIGLGLCLRLEACASQIHARFPTHATQDTRHCGAGFCLRGCHPLWPRYSSSFGYPVRADPGPTTPHLRSLSGRIRFAVFRFRSPLLTESQLISFPPLTKMLQFGGCPLVTEWWGLGPTRKSHSVIPVSTSPCDYAGHIAAWRDLLRLPSRAIPQTACLPPTCVGPTFHCVCEW
jgi:hypothetical protein